MYLEKIKIFFSNYYIYLLASSVIIYLITIISLDIKDINLKLEKNYNDTELQNKRIYKIVELTISSIFLTLLILSAIYRPPTDKLIQMYDILYIFPILLLILSILWYIQSPSILHIITISTTICVLIFRIRESINKNENSFSDERIDRIPPRVTRGI